jgi:hypothetical protein
MVFTYFVLFLKVPPEDARKLNLPPESLNRTPSGEIFVKPELQKVIAPYYNKIYFSQKARLLTKNSQISGHTS